MDKTMILTILVGAMVLVSALQTIQLLGLSNALSGAQVGSAPVIKTAGTTAAKAPAAAGANTNLKNLPSMVGGC